jgi:diguanylate cyclase (GGDEF)-like protein
LSIALVIHVEAPHTEIVQQALTDAGCTETWSVATVAEAIARCDGTRPDVVVYGVRTRRHLEELAALASQVRELPIVAIAIGSAVAAALDAGATDVATRPLRRPELVARLRAALRSQSRERALTDTVHQLRRKTRELERLVLVDPLTALANRRHVLDVLETEWRRSARETSPISIVMVDLDYFHAYNECYGHLGGDACLRQVSTAMATCLRRPSDVLGRYGGEEFIAVLPNTDAAGSAAVAERLRRAVEALAIPHVASQCAGVVTISVGTATDCGSHDQSPDALVAAADVALLRAKASGRNRLELKPHIVRNPDTVRS